MTAAKEHRIEVVRGGQTGSRGDEILAFWSGRAALTGASAEQRLAEVVCVLLDSDDAVVGVNSVYEGSLPLFGDRRLWIYRMLLADDARDSYLPMVEAALRTLEAEFDAEGDGPLGLCAPSSPTPTSCAGILRPSGPTAGCSMPATSRMAARSESAISRGPGSDGGS